MNNPQITIKPGRDKKAYRLRCRFKTDPYIPTALLDREKVRVGEMFVEDMRKQGWVYDTRYGFKLTGPYPTITPITVHVPRQPTAREMLSGVSQGDRFLDPGGNLAITMPQVASRESWDYEIASIFIRDELMVEVPDLHEERG